MCQIKPIILSLGEESQELIKVEHLECYPIDAMQGIGIGPGIIGVGDGGETEVEAIIKQLESEKNHPILVHTGTGEISNGLGLLNKPMETEPFTLRNYHIPDLLPTNFMYDDKDTFNEAKHIESCNKARKKRKRKKRNRR